MIRLMHGDCLDVLPTLPAESIQCVVTSPPYYGLRDYGTASWDGGDPACDHGAERVARRQAERQPSLGGGVPGSLRDKPVTACPCGAQRIDRQLGLEKSPQEYVDKLVAVFREVRRVLHPSGVAFLNLGDGYASKPFAPWGIKPKDLLQIPARVAMALQLDGWTLRSEIIWAKKAPMPESARDRPTCAHEKVFLLTRSERYFYDADAVAEEAMQSSGGWQLRSKAGVDTSRGLRCPDRGDGGGCIGPNRAGSTRNLRNVWHLNPEPFAGAHFATMPATLAERCIKAGTSEKGQCPHCGSPWVRVVEKAAAPPPYRPTNQPIRRLAVSDAGQGTNGTGESTLGMSTSTSTTGWSPSCACPGAHEPVPQTVLDPFAGAATTLLVSDRLQRHAVGIELSPDYLAMARRRIEGDCPLFADVA